LGLELFVLTLLFLSWFWRLLFG